jgi:repressor LexA
VVKVGEKITEIQERILQFIEGMVRKTGYPPTIREIGNKFKIASTNGVRYHLSQLEKAGYITRKKSISRGIELREFPAAMSSGEVSEIPLLGGVAAGTPILAVENVDELISVDKMFVKGDRTFALRLTGDSMKDEGMLDGDIIIVNSQNIAQSGDIIVALFNDEATVKRYVIEKDRVVLKPANKEYDDIEVDEDEDSFRIIGRVVGVMRKL